MLVDWSLQNDSKLIYSSSAASYGENNLHPSNLYGWSKYVSEQYVISNNGIGLRYFNVYGDRQPVKSQYATLIGLFNSLKENNKSLTIVGDGEQRRDFTYVLDVVNANILAATKKIDKCFLGKPINIGTGKNYSVNEIAAMFSNNTVKIPDRVGETRETLADITRAQNVLGWSPKIILKDWINEFYGFRLHM